VTELGTIRPFAKGFAQGDRADSGDIAFKGSGLSLAIKRGATGSRIECAFKDVSAAITVEHEDDESLNVVIPWSERRFQYTSKQTALYSRGTVTAGARTYDFSTAFATLDYGRGVWPYSVTWNWANAAGVQDGQVFGLQFGGKWTDGTGQNENGFIAGGRLHKIHDDVVFTYGRFAEPWTLKSPRVDLTFTPFLHKRVAAPLLVASAELNLCFGHFSGTVIADGGDPIRIARLLGWAEEFRGRW
jgi:hypothetical protein